MSKIAVVRMIAGGFVLFAVLAIIAAQTDRFPGDLALLEAAQKFDRFGPIARFFRVPVDDWIIPIGTAVIVAALVLLNERSAAVAFTAVWIGPLFTRIVKLIVDRPRPEGDFVVHFFPGTPSWPSGHSFNAAIFATLVVLAAWRYLPRAYAWLTTAGAIVFVAVAGFARVWLGAHWPSDVVGGWLFGVLFGASAWLIAEWAGNVARSRPR
jgi:membrane-associated phospholipid phosphatase